MAINAGLLQIGDIGGLVDSNTRNSLLKQQMFLDSADKLADTYTQSKDKQDINDSLSKNFDPNTQKLNQDGAIKDLYGKNPALAQKMSQQFQTQKLADMKAQADSAEKMSQVGLNNANAGKANSEASNIDWKKQEEKTKQGLRFLGAATDQTSWDKGLEWARSNGFGHIADYLPKEFNPENKSSVYALGMDYLDQIKAKTDVQNANTNEMNAKTQAARAGMDYEVQTNRNNIDMRGQDNQMSIEQMKLAAEKAKQGYISPEQQFNMQKQQNEFKTSQIKNVNEVQDKINSTNYTIEQAGNVSKAAERLLSSKFISKGKDPKTGEYIPQDSNELGGFWGTLTSSSMNPLKTDAKAFATDYNLLVSGLKNNGVAQLKANVGSQGTITDSDAKMVADAQGAPSSAEELAKLPVNRQFEAINTLKKVNDRVMEINNAKNEKYKQQYGDIENQSLSVPNPRVAQPMAGNGNNDLSSLAPQTPPRGLPPIDMFNKPVQAPNGAVINKAKAQAIMNFLNQ